METILVTGGAGYIGSHTVKLLISKGYKVIVLDNLVNGHEWAVDKQAKFYNCDLSDKDALNKIFEENSITGVIHFAAFIEAGESMKDPQKFFNNNTLNTINLLGIMLKNKVLKIIFSSTAAVYGEPEYVPIDEKHPKNPTNYYGLSKLMIEQVLNSYNDAYGVEFIALRYFNACGADESGLIGESHNPESHLIPIILQVAKGEREKIFVFGDDYDTKDGTCVRDYIHVNDLSEAHILALEKLSEIKKGFFNLGNGNGFSVLEVINKCKEITQKEIKVEKSGRRVGDPATLIANYKLAKKVLGWTPKRDINSIIKTAWEWHKNN
ncbi:UDP-glucose 4-epimerase GalE [Bacteroidota bacterium]